MRHKLIETLVDLWRRAENDLADHLDDEALEKKERFNTIFEKLKPTTEEIKEINEQLESMGA